MKNLSCWACGRGPGPAGVIHINQQNNTVDVTIDKQKLEQTAGQASESRRRVVREAETAVEQANQQAINRPNSRRRISSPCWCFHSIATGKATAAWGVHRVGNHAQYSPSAVVTWPSAATQTAAGQGHVA